MNNVYPHHYLGQLNNIPFANKPSAALARCMPLANESDFDVFSQLPCSDAPILINFIEHYQILNELVNQANALWDCELTILLRISMPGGMRLPASLLADNVLLMQDVEPELKRLSSKVKHLLVIDDHFIRYQLEQGDNAIAISLFTLSAQQNTRFKQFIAKLAHYNIGEK
jgi:hypothetical protein